MNERTRGVNPSTLRSRGAVSSNGRPNLFRSQLMRRPTASSSNSSETMRLDVDILNDNSDIVARDQHGEFEIDIPPSLTVDDDEELAAIEDRQEIEKERQRLTEAVKHHQMGHSSVTNPTEELLEAVRASLRAKVASLADDNWMFEPEEQKSG